MMFVDGKRSYLPDTGFKINTTTTPENTSNESMFLSSFLRISARNVGRWNKSLKSIFIQLTNLIESYLFASSYYSRDVVVMRTLHLITAFIHSYEVKIT